MTAASSVVPAAAGTPPARRPPRGAGAVAVAAALCLLVLAPVALPEPMLGAISRALIAALFALAFNLLAGQAGMLSFGHAAYFAIGTFATIHAMTWVERGAPIPTPLLPLVGALAGGLAGAVAGFFATMRSGVYFSMVTLAIAELLYTLAPNLQGLFGGEVGISSFRQPFLIWTMGSETQVYGLILCWVVASTGSLWFYSRTLFGRLTLALRENERRLPALGYDVHMTKIVIFAISGLFCGIAGALLAIANESANYALFQLSLSAGVVLHTFIGGSTVFFGPALGGFVMTLFGYVTSDLTRNWLLYQGLLFILVMLKAPNGIAVWVLDSARAVARGGVAAALNLLAVLGSLVLSGGAAVLLCEVLASAMARDYRAAVERTGTWAPVPVFGRAWAPDSAITWIVPLVALAAAFGLARLTRQRPEAQA